MPVTINLILCDNCKHPVSVFGIKLEMPNALKSLPTILKYEFCDISCLHEWVKQEDI